MNTCRNSEHRHLTDHAPNGPFCWPTDDAAFATLAAEVAELDAATRIHWSAREARLDTVAAPVNPLADTMARIRQATA